MFTKLIRLIGITGIFVTLMIIVGCGLWGNGNPSEPSSGNSASPTGALSSSPVSTASSEAPSQTASPSPSPTNIEEEEIRAIISGMTLEQKIGQIILVGIAGTSIDKATKTMIDEQHVGGFIFYKNNFTDLNGSIRLVNDLKSANNGNPIPLFLSVDQEGGKVSRLPKDFAAIADSAKVGRTNDVSLAEQMGTLLARELQVMGLNVNFAPVLDINSNPNNPIIGNRSFGNNAELVTKMGLSEMKGLREGGTIAVVKHFPGHGDTTTDSHLDLPVVNKTTDQLEKLEWIPFKASIKEKADAVMIAHILFPLIDSDAPASFSKVIIGQQLRGMLGYDGVVITDDMTMGAIAKNYGIEEASVRSIEAGSDIILIAHGYNTQKKVYDKLLQSVKSGLIKGSRIDESVYRILSLKRKYELSDRPVSFPGSIDSLNNDIRSWVERLQNK